MDKRILIALCICLVLAAPLIVSVFLPEPVSAVNIATETSEPGMVNYNLKVKEGFFGEFCPVGKSCVPLEYKENVITNAGLNFVEFLMGVGANSPVKYLALGNTTAPAIGDTTLAGEQTADGLQRATGTYYDLGTGWWEINNTFTYTGSTSRVVNTTANFNATSSGTMYAGGTITTVTFTTNGDQLKLRHNFTFAEV